MSLPSAWVDRLFEKLVLVYGHAFLRRWEGLDMAKVKADWAHELRGYAQSPDAVRYALEHLPKDGPPTVLALRELCREFARRVPMTPPALPAPKPDPQRLAHTLTRLGQFRVGERDLRAWAWALKAREEAGERLTPAQRSAWREALATALAPRYDDEPAAVAEVTA